MALGYVSRRYPVTGVRPRRTDVRFVLDDALLRFWFRFVFPHRTVERYPNPRHHALRRHAFVRSWRGKPPPDVMLHRLDDLG